MQDQATPKKDASDKDGIADEIAAAVEDVADQLLQTGDRPAKPGGSQSKAPPPTTKG